MPRSEDAAATRRAALDVLLEVDRGGFSDRLVPARGRLFDDPRDRGFVQAMAMAALRWRGALDAVLAPLVRRGLEHVQPEARAALRLGAAQALLLGVPAAAAVGETVEALKMGESPEAAPLVNAVLRRIAAARPPLDPLATVPAWLLERWRRTYGEERARRLVEATLRPPRPFLVALGDRAALAERLAAAGVATAPAARHPRGLAVLGGAPQETEDFAAGSFVLLDEGAGLVALLAAPADERPVADVAAAPGGKAALLAPLARGGLAALELHGTRARLLGAALRRTARPGARTAAVRADALRPPLRDGVFGLALLDAPCTGTGTLRRRPEKRDRLVEADVAECAARQAAMLERTAALVGPGGALVYAVCSLEPEEGEERVRAFLAAHPEFAAEDPRGLLGAAGDGLVVGDPPLLRTRPDEEDTEGFVAARLVRRP